MKRTVTTLLVALSLIAGVFALHSQEAGAMYNCSVVVSDYASGSAVVGSASISCSPSVYVYSFRVCLIRSGYCEANGYGATGSWRSYDSAITSCNPVYAGPYFTQAMLEVTYSRGGPGTYTERYYSGGHYYGGC